MQEGKREGAVYDHATISDNSLAARNMGGELSEAQMGVVCEHAQAVDKLTLVPCSRSASLLTARKPLGYVYEWGDELVEARGGGRHAHWLLGFHIYLLATHPLWRRPGRWGATPLRAKARISDKLVIGGA